MQEVYRFETHLHTSEISPCSGIEAALGARLTRDAGCRGMMVVDHFYEGYVASAPVNSAARARSFFEGYRRARDEGERIGLCVLPGMELRYRGSYNDYLIFGIGEEMLAKLGDPSLMTPAEGFRTLTEAGCLIIQAHPFRKAMTRCENVHGCEIYNGHPKHASDNESARAWGAAHPAWIATAGSDVHQAGHVGRAGILAPLSAMEDAAAMVAWLRRGSPQIYTSGGGERAGGTHGAA